MLYALIVIGRSRKYHNIPQYSLLDTPKFCNDNDDAYAKFWSDQQRVLWYAMVFSGVGRELEPKMRPAIVSGIVPGDVPVSYCSPERIPEVFAKVNSTQSLSRF